MKLRKILFLSLPVALTFACSDDANLGSDQGKDPVGATTVDAASPATSGDTSDVDDGDIDDGDIDDGDIDDGEPSNDVTETTTDDVASDPVSEPSDSETDEGASLPPADSDEPTSEPAPDATTSDSDEPAPDTSSSDPDPEPELDAGPGTSTPSDAGSDNPEPTPECEQIQCFRAVECVETCGGPVLAAGCCPCAEGTFDSIMCSEEPAPDAGSSSDGGIGYSLDDLHSWCVDGACPEGLTAMTYFGIAGPNGPSFCSCEIPCAEDPNVCPEGSSCGTISDGPGTVCIR